MFLNLQIWFYLFFNWSFLRSWYRCPKAVVIIGGICFNNNWLLRPGHVRKFTFSIVSRKVIGVCLKQHLWRYWISSVFVLSMVIIAWSQCLKCLEMGMSHIHLYCFCVLLVWVYCPYEYLFNCCLRWQCSNCHKFVLRKWAMHCVIHQIRVPFFAWALRLLDSARIPVFVALIVALFENWTVDPLQVPFMFVRNAMYFVCQ